MTELDDIAAKFGTSEPVFKVSLDSSGKLRFEVKNEYKPQESDDPVYTLIASTFSEHLDKHSKRFEARVDIERAYANIINHIRQVVVNASPLKNPKQSKLYKWLCERDPVYHNPSSAGFIALYRYVVANGIEEIRDDTNPHAKNVIAILELMREKYEDKSRSNQ